MPNKRRKQGEEEQGIQEGEWVEQTRAAVVRKPRAQRPAAFADDESHDYRDYEKHIHQGLVDGSLTIGLRHYGMHTMPHPNLYDTGLQNKSIPFDTFMSIIRENPDEPRIELKELAARMSPIVVKNISRTTVGAWGKRDESNTPPASRGKIDMVAFNSLRASIIASLSGLENVDIISSRFFKACEDFSKEGAFENCQRHPGHRRLTNLRTAIQNAWDPNRRLNTPEEIRDYKEAFAGDFAFHPELVVVLDDAIEGRKIIPRVLGVMRSKAPLAELHKIGNVENIDRIMRMSPHAQQFVEYMSRNAMRELCAQRIIQTLPPKMSDLIMSGPVASLHKNQEFSTLVETTIGLNAGSQQDHSRQATLAAPIKDAILTEVGKLILRRESMTEESKKKISDILEASERVKTLRTNLGKPKTDGEEGKIDWAQLVHWVYNRTEKMVDNMIKSYLTQGVISIQLRDQDEAIKQEYLDVKGLACFLLDFMLYSPEQYANEIGKEAYKAINIDKTLASDIECLNITTDMFDRSVRVTMAKRLFSMFERVPNIAEHFLSKYIFYFAQLELSCVTSVKPIIEGLASKLTQGFSGARSVIARDVLFVLCKVAGNSRANTFSKFSESLSLGGIMIGYARSCICEKTDPPLVKVNLRECGNHLDLTAADLQDKVRVAIWSSEPAAFDETLVQGGPEAVNAVTDPDCMIVEPRNDAAKGAENQPKAVVDARKDSGPNTGQNTDEDEEFPIVHLDCYNVLVPELRKACQEISEEVDIQNIVQYIKTMYKKHSKGIEYEASAELKKKQPANKAASYGASLVKAMLKAGDVSEEITDQHKEYTKDRKAASQKLVLIAKILTAAMQQPTSNSQEDSNKADPSSSTSNSKGDGEHTKATSSSSQGDDGSAGTPSSDSLRLDTAKSLGVPGNASMESPASPVTVSGVTDPQATLEGLLVLAQNYQSLPPQSQDGSNTQAVAEDIQASSGTGNAQPQASGIPDSADNDMDTGA